MKVEPSKELVDLHLRVLDDLKNKYGVAKNKFEGPEQQFHTTLAYQDIEEEMFLKAKKDLSNEPEPKITFKFDSIGLFLFTGEEWIITRKYKVGR